MEVRHLIEGDAVGGDVHGTLPNDIFLNETGVSPGTFGDESHSARVTVDDKGRVTDISQVPVSTAPNRVGLYNLEAGLIRWRLSRGMAGKDITGAGLGGVDIVAPWDSLGSGYGGAGTDPLPWQYSSPIHRLKVRLQNYFNPPGVIGGYGFMRTVFASGIIAPTTESTWTDDHDYAFAGTLYSTTNGARARVSFNGGLADAAFRKTGVTSFDLVMRRASGNGALRYDVNTGDAFVAAGSGALGTGTINLSHGSEDAGYRTGAALNTSGLSPSANNIVQFSPISSSRVDVQGILAYNGDETCGVRVHNLALGGSTVTDLNGSTTAKQVIAKFAAGGAWGAVNARLIIMDFITNDILQGYTVSQFKTAYQSVITYMTGLGMSVLLFVPPKPDIRVGSYATTFANYAEYVAALYQLVDANDHVALVDIWAMLVNSEREDWEDAYNWGFSGDGLHYTDRANQTWADILFHALIQ